MDYEPYKSGWIPEWWEAERLREFVAVEKAEQHAAARRAERNDRVISWTGDIHG
jgi:hypothetical protein